MQTIDLRFHTRWRICEGLKSFETAHGCNRRNSKLLGSQRVNEPASIPAVDSPEDDATVRADVDGSCYGSYIVCRFQLDQSAGKSNTLRRSRVFRASDITGVAENLTTNRAVGADVKCDNH